MHGLMEMAKLNLIETVSVTRLASSWRAWQSVAPSETRRGHAEIVGHSHMQTETPLRLIAVNYKIKFLKFRISRIRYIQTFFVTYPTLT